MISSGRILAFIDRLERENVCLHGFELRSGGSVAAEGYYAPFKKGQPHRMYSVSKSMVSLAVGMLIEEGRIGFEDRIVAFFPDKLHGKPDERLARLCIRDMLRMATCFKKTTYKEGIDYSWSDSYFTAVPDHEPGTMFFYDTSCSQVLAELCRRVSGRTVLEYLTEHFFSRIGADGRKRWLTDPAGELQGGTGLLMSLEDLGKISQCIMDGGRGILPEEYLKEATSMQIGTFCHSNPEERFGYGYQFWRTRSGYAMYGMGGQMAIFCPQEDLLLCTIADTRLDPYGVQRIYNAFYDEIVTYAGEAEDHAADERLKCRLADLSCAALAHVPGKWNTAKRIYRMEENEAGLIAVAFADQTVSLEWKDGVHTFAWDAFGRNAEGVFAASGIPSLTSAALDSVGALRIRCQLIGDAPCGLEMLLCEKNDTLSLRMMKSSDPMTNRYDGQVFGKKI